MPNDLAFGILNSSANYIHVEGMQNYRPIGAFSFLGRYRIVDFPFSNMSNSEIDQIKIYLRENPRSLTEHIRSTATYNINSKSGHIQILFANANSASDIYNTDIAAFMENLSIIERTPYKYVIIAPSYFVYTQDYSEMLRQHIDSGADISLLYQRVTDARENYLDCDFLNMNRQKGVTSIERNRGTAKERNIYMDTCVMERELFIHLIQEAMKISSVYTLAQIINQKASELDIRGINHRGFFAAITSFKNYYDANMELLGDHKAEELFDPNWPIYTVTSNSCPTRYFEDSKIKNSLVSNGCQIYGTVENCVIGRNVEIRPGAEVRNSILLANSVIGENIHLENQVIDKWAQVVHIDEIISTPEHPGYVKREDII